MRRREFVARALAAMAGLAGCGTATRPTPSFSVVPGGEAWVPVARVLAGQFKRDGVAEGGPLLTVTGLPAIAAAEMAGVKETGTPLARLVGDVEVLVVSNASVFREFDDFARRLVADPGGTVLGGRPQGESDHLLFGLVARGLGADARVLDYAGYPTTDDAAEALLAGRVGVAAGPLGEWRKRLGKGRLRALAVSSAERVEDVEAPTLLESGVRVDFADWCAVLGPKQMSERDRARAVEVLDEVARSARWLDACRARGWKPIPLSGDDFAAWLGSEAGRTREVLKDLGLIDTTCWGSCVRGH
ncbi:MULTISPECIES: Bug family tripartite tricarboxylate transporter substrate binding protein [Nonomuraea]|uniref:Bug family tripartite tricarboxylate transporter substrate binding protein n=1 Tax=Nonomuraea mangrovi TaxID=2316207 RepID=A0ABW4SZS0_9ACTN